MLSGIHFGPMGSRDNDIGLSSAELTPFSFFVCLEKISPNYFYLQWTSIDFFKGSVCHSLFLSPSSPCCQVCTLALDYLLLIYFKNPPSKFDSRATNSCRLVSAHPSTPWIKIGPNLSPRLGFLHSLLNSGHDQIVEAEL